MRNGVEDETETPLDLSDGLRKCSDVITSLSEYDAEAAVLKHRQIIALCNKELNNLFRYTLQARLKVLERHHLDFQVDIKTLEEYLFLLRKLELADCKGLTPRIK